MTSAFLLAKVIISKVYILIKCLFYFVVFLKASFFRVISVMLCGFVSFKLFSQGAFGYVLPIISFILAWIETWFLDFKVLPQEAEEENSKLLIFPLNHCSWQHSIPCYLAEECFFQLLKIWRAVGKIKSYGIIFFFWKGTYAFKEVGF